MEEHLQIWPRALARSQRPHAYSYHLIQDSDILIHPLAGSKSGE